MSAELSSTQRHLLGWLARDDTSQYGEYEGPDLDALHGAGFVHTWVRGGVSNLWPPPSVRHPVYVTVAGYRYIRECGIDVWEGIW